ncbi:hypothetical protein HDU96_007299 [Phlyctochytrium bullatum]|nr:hypothetical protein HDU96_007299 [Phlyctochytrium bullatum]
MSSGATSAWATVSSVNAETPRSPDTESSSKSLKILSKAKGGSEPASRKGSPPASASASEAVEDDWENSEPTPIPAAVTPAPPTSTTKPSSYGPQIVENVNSTRTEYVPQIQIMRREPKNNSSQQGSSSSSTTSSPTTSAKGLNSARPASPATMSGTSTTKTLAEREAEYRAARMKIFGKEEPEPEKDATNANADTSASNQGTRVSRTNTPPIRNNVNSIADNHPRIWTPTNQVNPNVPSDRNIGPSRQPLPPANNLPWGMGVGPAAASGRPVGGKFGNGNMPAMAMSGGAMFPGPMVGAGGMPGMGMPGGPMMGMGMGMGMNGYGMGMTGMGEVGDMSMVNGANGMSHGMMMHMPNQGAPFPSPLQQQPGRFGFPGYPGYPGPISSPGQMALQQGSNLMPTAPPFTPASGPNDYNGNRSYAGGSAMMNGATSGAGFQPAGAGYQNGFGGRTGNSSNFFMYDAGALAYSPNRGFVPYEPATGSTNSNAGGVIGQRPGREPVTIRPPNRG